MRKTQTGIFIPKHPEKYKGNPNNIIYRSSWELRVMVKLDTNPSILSWASEEMAVRYFDPASNKMRRYFPDFIIKSRTSSGGEKMIMLEIKPYKQTIPPEKKKKKTKTYITEVNTYITNSAKWKAARSFCEQNNMDFIIFTEHEIL